MKDMVVGFLFDLDLNYVVLIRKNRPDFMIGKLNGPGGGVKEGEKPHEAMCREFKEECGLSISSWQYFVTMSGCDWRVFCYCATSPKISEITSCTDEKVRLYRVDMLHIHNLVINVDWLISLAVTFLEGHCPLSVTNDLNCVEVPEGDV